MANSSAYADIFVGGNSVSVLNEAISLNSSTSSSSSSGTTNSAFDRFWSSSTDVIDSTIQEVLEINFSSAGLTNRISFEAAKFPQTITLEYSIDTGDNWQPVVDNFTGQPVVIPILNSFPVVLPSPGTINGHKHPQHDYDGHWLKLSLQLVPAKIKKVRFKIVRNPAGQPPVDITGSHIPYSVALQNIHLAYEIADKDDVPTTNPEPGSPASTQTFANTTDLLGSNLGFSTKTNYAKNLLYNSDASAPLIWKSEPQPFPEAVVNFYADLRKKDGSAQAIDQIFIDPLYNGSNINLYYSNDVVKSPFASARDVLATSDAITNNVSLNTDGSLSLGQLKNSPFTPGSITINNASISFDPSIPWWIGMQFSIPAGQPIVSDPNSYTLFDGGQFKIGYNNTGFYITTASGDTNTINFAFTTAPIQLIVAYVDGNLHVSAVQSTLAFSNDKLISVPFTSALPNNLYLGADSINSSSAYAILSAFILKQEPLVSDDFLTQPTAYSTVGSFNTDSPGESNALLRYDSTFISQSTPTGLVGGPAFHYENLIWTPIPRKYEMQRGNMMVPLTVAKFWKLEITNLKPQISEKYIPVTVNVKTFPPSITSIIAAKISSALSRFSSSDLAADVQSQLSNALGFIDSPAFVGTGSGALTGYTNTEAYIATDYSTRQKLAELGNKWRYEPLSPVKTAPRFPNVGRHDYDEQKITQKTNVSYFAGLRRIVFSRTQLTIPQEFPDIKDDFVDSIYIGNGNWQITPNNTGLYSGQSLGATYAQSTSVLIPTQRGVRGIQFAAQQTDAKEISIYGDFDDENYDPNGVTTWTPVGDGKILGIDSGGSSTSTHTDTALEVSRQTNLGFWADIPINFLPGTWAAIGAGLTTFGQMGSGTLNSSYQGGIQSSSVGAPLGGRVHAAARVTTTKDLTQPLWIQILDSDTGAVISEQQSSVGKNNLQEWYTSIDVSAFGAQVGQTWGGLIKKSIWPTFNDTFVRANSPSLGNMNTGQPWVTPAAGTSLAILSNQASVGATGARSQVDTGTPWGTLTVTLANAITTGSHGSAVPVVDLGGINLMNDGTFETTDVSATLATLVNPLAAHTYTFQFVPTSLVPIGQQVAGTDPIVQPYSIIVLDNNVWSQTITITRAFSSLRALMGSTGQLFSQFKWVPTRVQVDQSSYQLSMPIPPSSALINDDGALAYEWDVSPGEVWHYSGLYTYGSTLLANTLSSLAPGGGTMSAAPTGLSGSAINDGTGTFSAGTYFWKITAVTANGGETTGSNEVTFAVAANGTASLSWTAVGSAVSYNVYRSTSSNSEHLVGSASSNAFLDVGSTPTSAIPVSNTTQGGGTMAVVDVDDQYGAMKFNVTQMPSGLANSVVVLAYINYNPTSGKIIQLLGDGTIFDLVGSTTLKSSMFSNPLTGPISIRYISAKTLSSSFKTTWSVGGSDTQAIVFLQNNVVVGVYSGTGIWDTTVRGLGGANNGTTSNAYTIIEGFSWSPDASLWSVDTASGTWAEVSYNDTRTYGLMSNTVLGTTRNLAVQLIQKSPTLDFWYVQSCTLFWDPVIWEFSCDGGITWWEAFDDIRNNPFGVMLFPYGLTSYSNLKWRITSYSGNVTVDHLQIRPWYIGMHGSLPPRPTQLPIGPNIVPTDGYDFVEKDPRFQVWDKPVPRWWWNRTKQLTN